MKRKAIIPLMLGLVIGLVAVKALMSAIRKAQASTQATATMPTVVAKQDINAYEEIRQEMIEVIETSDTKLIPSIERLDSLEKVKGRVVGKSIPKGLPIFASMLTPEGTRPGMVGRIPTGFRAVSVKIDEVTGVSYQIKPGDWVDVTVVIDIETGSREKETMAEVILQRVQVVAIGQGATNEQEAASGTKVKPAKSATLLVHEDDVPKLHLAGTRGKLTLALRGEDDEEISEPATAYHNDYAAGPKFAKGLSMPEPIPAKSDTVKKPTRPRPAEPVAPPHTVTVYRPVKGAMPGTGIERITFENAYSSHIVDVTQGSPSRAAATMSSLKERGFSRSAPPPEPIEEAEEPADSNVNPDNQGQTVPQDE